MLDDPVWQFILALVVIAALLTVASIVKYLVNQIIEKEQSDGRTN